MSYRFLRGVLVLVALPPIVEGIAGATNGTWVAKWYSFSSRATVTLTPEMNYLLKVLGIYLMLFGALMAYASTDPKQHRSLITLGAIVLLLQAFQRLSLTGELHELFNVPIWLNLFHGMYLLLLALALLWLRPKASTVLAGERVHLFGSR